MKKGMIWLYSLLCYGVGLGATVVYCGFLGGMPLPRTIQSGEPVSIPAALGTDLLLVVLFGLQHSGMARQTFKQWYRRRFPSATERSTYVLLSSLSLLALVGLWRPVSPELYDLRGTVSGLLLTGLYGLGWGICLFSTYLIDHFDLFGLRQAWYYGRGETDHPPQFRTPLLYRVVRHPIYLGWLMIHWFTPFLTLGQVFLALAMTVYLLIGMHYEEKDLIRQFDEEYLLYRKTTPRILPFLPTKIVSEHEKTLG
ncbi:methyltransferase family protein [Larkinella soli]|uniref:methyltransferase family protein n=1 Tax=Larkinella soli TaxID=1770527 RepID=UPI000FFC7494|nr:isoprenylcysteine carboxylmethyltransferase family protein [Larkinella soli]